MRTACWCSIVSLAWLSTGCLSSGAAAAAPPVMPSSGALEEAEAARSSAAPEGGARRGGDKLVITADLTAVTDDVAGLVAAIAARAAGAGGSIAREEVSGDAQHREAMVVVRLPPAAMNAFIDWMTGQAALEERHLQATDVTRKFFDRDLAIRNLEITMSRLQELAQRQNAELKDIITIEHEMTRVRGELESLRGEQRLLGDQVARATLTISLRMKHGVHAEPELKFELVPHLTLLHLVDAGSRTEDRAGLGVGMMFSRWFSLDFEVLPQRNADPPSYLFTMSTATYSDFLGGGRRRFGNPYLGLRLGGAKMNGLGAFAYGAEAGLELVRFKLFLVEISGRALGLWYNRDAGPRSDIVLEGIAGIGVPF